MGHWIPLSTARGDIRAWQATPVSAPKGAVIVVQEIFGANAHIRDIAERLADAGFVALAPAMFDLVEPAVELDYDEAGMARGRKLAAELGFDAAVDILSAANHMFNERSLDCAIVGFCWGGSVALLGNTRLGLPAVSYYGARSIPFLDEPLQAPMLLHFGEKDDLIPLADIHRHRAAYPQAQIHMYEGAGHAFNRDSQPNAPHYEPQAAALAWRRTLDFLQTTLT